MVRRVVDHGVTDRVESAEVVEHASIASIVANVLTVLYATVVSLIGLDALLAALGARESNDFVAAVDKLSDPLLAPFDGMFADQRYWATALIAVVVYTLAYLVLMAALRRGRTL